MDASKFTATQLWQVANAGDVIKLAAGQTAGFRSITDTAVTVTAAATSKSASVALDGVKGDGASNIVTLAVSAPAAGGVLETINVAGTIAKNLATGPDASLNLTATVARSAETITLNTAVKTTLTLAETAAGAAAKDVKTFDASGSTGGIDVGTQLSGGTFGNIETIKLGSGNDKLTVAQAGKNTTVDAGAGNDVITVNFDGAAGKQVTITTGAGNDIVKFGTIAASAVDADADTLAASLVTVTDFTRGSDAIEVGNGIISFATQSVIDGLVAGKATLFDAVKAVVTSTET